MTTRDEALDAAARDVAASNAAIAHMTPREQAEAAYTPTGPSVDELEARIRRRRGLPLIANAS
ncbi:MAG: hypothetical protein JWP31_1802 [Aeromicrobium sp.]|nr:hypothetical protein [Aeromicrobium sp.]